MASMHAPTRPTVALAVVPKLLSDTLTRALAALDVEVVDGSACTHADVVLVSGLPAVPARVVIVLPGEADAGLGTVLAAGRRERVVLDSPAAVVAVVRAHC